ERPRLAEARERRWRRRALRATRDDDVGVTVLDAAHGESDGVGGRSARAHDAEIRAAQAELDAEMARDHVADGARDVERRSLFRVVSALPRDRFVFDARETADARTHD